MASHLQEHLQEKEKTTVLSSKKNIGLSKRSNADIALSSLFSCLCRRVLVQAGTEEVWEKNKPWNTWEIGWSSSMFHYNLRPLVSLHLLGLPPWLVEVGTSRSGAVYQFLRKLHICICTMQENAVQHSFAFFFCIYKFMFLLPPLFQHLPYPLCSHAPILSSSLSA